MAYNMFVNEMQSVYGAHPPARMTRKVLVQVFNSYLKKDPDKCLFVMCNCWTSIDFYMLQKITSALEEQWTFWIVPNHVLYVNIAVPEPYFESNPLQSLI